VILHGITAAPAARWYGKVMADKDFIGEDVPEMKTVSALPVRGVRGE